MDLMSLIAQPGPAKLPAEEYAQKYPPTQGALAEIKKTAEYI